MSYFKKTCSITVFWLAAAGGASGQTNFPQVMPADTVYGSQYVSGPGGAISFIALAARLLNNSAISGPIIIGGGAPLTGSQPLSVIGSSQFIPSSVTTTPTPAVTIQRSTTYSTGSPVSPTAYVLTQAALNGASAWVDGIYSEVDVTSNGIAGSFAEAIRGICRLSSGITNSVLCTGGTFLALNTPTSPAVSAALVGVEAEVDNFSSNSISPPSWTASQPWRVSFVASSGNNDSTNIATAGFMVNPYTTSGYQSGFYCAPEASPGGAGNEIHYGCFVGQVTAPYGLDLSLGTWTTKAINAAGFSVDNTGAVLLSKAGTMLNGLSSNTGGANLIEVQNSGTSTNTLTGAQFTAAISSLGAAYWFVEVVGGSGGSGLTAQMATGADLANGFFITSGAGPITLNGASGVKIASVFGLTPATWADNQTCAAGQITADTGFIYVCTASNTVKRAALSTF